MYSHAMLLHKLKFVWMFVVSGVILCPEASQAQQDSMALSAMYFKEGMEVYDFSHRKQAADLFMLSSKMNPKNARALFMAGQSIMLTINKERSLPYFLRAMRLDPAVDEEILYFIGQGYHYSEKYDSAILFYEAFNKKLARSLQFEKSVKMTKVDRKIFECHNAIVYKANPVKVTITNLHENINSEYPDYAPNITADGLQMIYTSRRPDNANHNVAADHEYYEEIYESRKVDGAWTPAKIMPEPVNSKYHNSSLNLSPDGSEMFIYNDTNGGDIYVTYKHNGIWSPETPLEGDVNTPASENSATITRDGKKLFFSSTRPGGYGGTDIYVSTKGRNGRWVNVTNLGPVVNTELEEDGVFISESGKHLYFSSNGHAGMGDLDLYRSTYDSVKGVWGTPVNLGYPINSPENDIYFVLTGDESYGFFSSVKAENKGEQDIYQVDMSDWKELHIDELIARANPEPLAQVEKASSPKEVTPRASPEPVAQTEKAKMPQAPITPASSEPVVQPEKANTSKASSLDLDLLVMDASTFALLDAKVNLVDPDRKLIPVPAVKKGNHVIHIARRPGSLDRYGVRVSSGDHQDYESHFYMVGSMDDTKQIVDTIFLKKQVQAVFGGILNVYFALNSDKPRSFLDTWAIVKFLKENMAATVMVSGYTDSYGDADYNMNLSNRRAESVKNYLIKAGISVERISATGYGEEKPVADNKTAQGRSLNRRTEFTILNYNSAPKLQKEF